MANLSHRQLQWLSSLSTQEACKEIVKGAIAGTAVDAKKVLRTIAPLPDLSNGSEVRTWLDWVLAQADLSMSADEIRALQDCCETVVALFEHAHGRKVN
jgi:hypothetical protein